MKTITRSIYCILLRLHPEPFRTRFADEMLWIFDARDRTFKTLPLILDCILSVALQHAIARCQPSPQSSSLYLEIDSAVPMRRLAHAGLILLPFIGGIALFVGPWSPQPKTTSHFTHTRWFLTQVLRVSSLNRPKV
jgi:hypothetical protein